MLVYCGQTVGWIKMPLGTEVGLSPGHIVLDRNPAFPPPPQKKEGTAAPQFSSHVYCGQTAWWIRMPLGKEVGLNPDHILSDWYPVLLPPKGHSSPHFLTQLPHGKRHSSSPHFRPMSIVAKRSNISTTFELLFIVVHTREFFCGQGVVCWVVSVGCSLLV